MRRLSLAVLAIAFALPGTGLADTFPPEGGARNVPAAAPVSGATLPDAGLADTLPTEGVPGNTPAAPDSGATPPVPCDRSCVDSQVLGDTTKSRRSLRRTALPGENEHLADLFLLALLAALVLLVPVIVIRQRNARDPVRPAPFRKPMIRLIMSRSDKNGGR
jgi:hypothetical protein